jgi:hypothetical protein
MKARLEYDKRHLFIIARRVPLMYEALKGSSPVTPILTRFSTADVANDVGKLSRLKLTAGRESGGQWT